MAGSPYSQDGKDYYLTPEGQIVNVDAGFDTSTDYPGLVPATKDDYDVANNERASAKIAVDARFDRNPDGFIDPDAAFASDPEVSTEQVEAHVALPKPEPEKPTAYSRDGRDYYLTKEGKIASVDAGFDVSTDYPDLVPATAEDVRKRELQEKHGGFREQLKTIPEAASATVAELVSGLDKERQELAWWGRYFGGHDYNRPAYDPNAYVKPEQIAPEAYTKEAKDRREANPTATMIGAAVPDLAVNLLIPEAAPITMRAHAAQAARLAASGMVAEAGDAVISGEEFELGDALGLWAPTQAVFEPIAAKGIEKVAQGLGWAKATARNALDASVEKARRARVADTLQETNPQRRIQKLRKHGDAVLDTQQEALDAALETIDAQMRDAPEKLFTPSALKKAVSDNLVEQRETATAVATKFLQASVVTDSKVAHQAYELITDALEKDGHAIFGALRQARQMVADEAASSALVREAADGLDKTLTDARTWGRAAKHHAEVTAARGAGAGSSASVRDVAAREALEGRFESARAMAALSGNKELSRAVQAAEDAIARSSEVHGARVMGEAVADEVADFRKVLDGFPERQPKLTEELHGALEKLELPETFTPERVERHVIERAAGSKAAREQIDGMLEKTATAIAAMTNDAAKARAKKALNQARKLLDEVDQVPAAFKRVRDFDAQPRGTVEKIIDKATGRLATAVLGKASSAAAGYVAGGYPGMAAATAVESVLEPHIRDQAKRFGSWMKDKVRKYGKNAAGIGALYGANRLANDEDNPSPNAAMAVGMLGLPMLMGKAGGKPRTLLDAARELDTALKANPSPHGEHFWDEKEPLLKAIFGDPSHPAVNSTEKLLRKAQNFGVDIHAPDAAQRLERELRYEGDEIFASRVKRAADEFGDDAAEEVAEEVSEEFAHMQQPPDVKAALKDARAEWSADAKKALKWYQSQMGYKINEELRGLGKGAQFGASPGDVNMALQDAIDAGATAPGLVYRGVELSPDEIAQLRNAKKLTAQAFVSATANPKIAKRFANATTTRGAQMFRKTSGKERVLFEIEQENGVAISPGEVLMRPGTQYRVVGHRVEPMGSKRNPVDVNVFRVREVGHDPRALYQRVPTEGIIAGGLLGLGAADAALNDDESGAAAAGVGGLALLFGGRGRLRLARELERKAGQKWGLDKTLGATLQAAEPTVKYVAKRGLWQEPEAFKRDVLRLKDGLSKSAEPIVTKALGTRPPADTQRYTDAFVDRVLAEAAESAPLDTPKARRVRQRIDAEREKGVRSGPLFDEFAGPKKLLALNAESKAALERIPEGEIRDNAYISTTGADVKLRETLDAHGTLAGDEDPTPWLEQYVEDAVAENVDYWSGQVTEEVRDYYAAKAREELARAVDFHALEASFNSPATGGAGLGLRVRSALRDFLEDDAGTGFSEAIRSQIERGKRGDQLGHQHVDRYRNKMLGALSDAKVPDDYADDIVDDLIEAAEEGRPMGPALNEVVEALTEGTERSFIPEDQHRLAVDAFRNWARDASKRYGFNIERTLQNYAGDYDYKHINAFARGNLDDVGDGVPNVYGHEARDLQLALDAAVTDGYTMPGTVWRGTLMSNAELARLRASPVAEAHGFMSTTSDPQYAERFIAGKEQLKENPELNQVIFEVKQRRGVPFNVDENEVILRAGTKFKVEPDPDNPLRFQLIEDTASEPKLPSTVNAKSALPWVAGGILALGATQDDVEGAAGAGVGLGALALAMRGKGGRLLLRAGSEEAATQAAQRLAGAAKTVADPRLQQVRRVTDQVFDTQLTRDERDLMNFYTQTSSHIKRALADEARGTITAQRQEQLDRFRSTLQKLAVDEPTTAGPLMRGVDMTDSQIAELLDANEVQLENFASTTYFPDKAAEFATSVPSEWQQFGKSYSHRAGTEPTRPVVFVFDHVESGSPKFPSPDRVNNHPAIDNESEVILAPGGLFEPTHVEVTSFNGGPPHNQPIEGLRVHVRQVGTDTPPKPKIKLPADYEKQKLTPEYATLKAADGPMTVTEYQRQFAPGEDIYALRNKFRRLQNADLVKLEPVGDDIRVSLVDNDGSKKPGRYMLSLSLGLGAGAKHALDDEPDEGEDDGLEDETRALLEQAEAIREAREQQLDATRAKLGYLAAQSRAQMALAARSVANPAGVSIPIEPVAGVTSNAGITSFLGPFDNVRAAYEARKAVIEQHERDPMSLVDDLTEQYAELADAAPELHAQMSAQTFKVAQFIRSKMPPTTGISMSRPEGSPPSQLVMRQFALYYSAATDPSSVVRDVQNNRVRREQLDTLKELWPDTYTRLRSSVLEQVASSRPTVQQRMRLDVLFDFGPALDKALSPNVVAALDAYRAKQPANGNGGAPGGVPDRRSQPSIVGTSALGSLNVGAARGPGIGVG